MDEVDTISSHYGVNRDVIARCVAMTISKTGASKKDVFTCIMDKIFELKLPIDMTSNIFSFMDPDAFMKICALNPEYAEKCKHAWYWLRYLQGRSDEDWVAILKEIPRYRNVELYRALMKEFQRRFVTRTVVKPVPPPTPGAPRQKAPKGKSRRRPKPGEIEYEVKVNIDEDFDLLVTESLSMPQKL